MQLLHFELSHILLIPSTLSTFNLFQFGLSLSRITTTTCFPANL